MQREGSRPCSEWVVWPKHMGLLGQGPLQAVKTFIFFLTLSLGSCFPGCPRGAAVNWGEPLGSPVPASSKGKQLTVQVQGLASSRAFPASYGEEGRSHGGQQATNMHRLAPVTKFNKEKVRVFQECGVLVSPHPKATLRGQMTLALRDQRPRLY